LPLPFPTNVRDSAIKSKSKRVTRNVNPNSNVPI
jgi:hypothetical protein